MKNTFYAKYGKRMFDILCCMAVIIFFWWALLFIAVLVRVKMGSPVVFVHERPGMIDPKTGKEKIFKLYKFRSMTNETDADGVLLPSKDRLTKFGRILRSTSMDELPEIWNILKGDMSLVGPRPLNVKYLDFYTPEEHRRHLVRPGLTGLAQVNGRTGLKWETRFEFDTYYVDNMSFLLDLKILVMTVVKVFKRSDIKEAGSDNYGNFYDYRQKQWDSGEVTKSEQVR